MMGKQASVDVRWHDVSRQVADKIKQRLTECGITKKQFAEMMDISPSGVTRWLSGKCNFEIFTLFKMEEKLGIKLIAITSPTTLSGEEGGEG